VAVVPEVPGWAGVRPSRRSGAEGKEIRLHPRKAVSLGKLGRAEGQGRQAGPQQGDDLRDFVNLKLFPYLHGFKLKASGPNTIEYKIGEIFGGQGTSYKDTPSCCSYLDRAEFAVVPFRLRYVMSFHHPGESN
jgi:hypothetical protein